MVIDFAQFCANLVLATLLFRFLQMKLAGTDYGKALSFVTP